MQSAGGNAALRVTFSLGQSQQSDVAAATAFVYLKRTRFHPLDLTLSREHKRRRLDASSVGDRRVRAAVKARSFVMVHGASCLPLARSDSHLSNVAVPSPESHFEEGSSELRTVLGIVISAVRPERLRADVVFYAWPAMS
ncbi:hypothetical protein MRX96_029844 [Rhipicephalus microplus]